MAVGPPVKSRLRCLPFGAEGVDWGDVEAFWLDFLNRHPLLPWPADRSILKRVRVAEGFGSRGHKQRGVDCRAVMEDESVLIAQIKDHALLSPGKGRAAMDKAEEEYPKVDAYFLVASGRVSPDLMLEADRRGNWIVWSGEQFSSWILNPDHLPRHVAAELIERHFDEVWARELVPLSVDGLFVDAENYADRYTAKRGPHHHEVGLVGEAVGTLVDELEGFVEDGDERVAVIVAPGGTGKSRVLVELAKRFDGEEGRRRAVFVNDDADPAGEVMSLRQLDVANSVVILDDAHRLGNLRPRLLRELAGNERSRLVVATRPAAQAAVVGAIRNGGYREEDLGGVRTLPALQYEDRLAIAKKILGEGYEAAVRHLAEISIGCPLVCVVGAELIKRGEVSGDLVRNEGLRERVFDHLEGSLLRGLYPDAGGKRSLASRVLRAFAVLGPYDPERLEASGQSEKGPTGIEQLGEVFGVPGHEIEEMIGDLRGAGTLVRSAGGLRVVPDLLSDHLVYEVAYGEKKLSSLVSALVSKLGDQAMLPMLANLSEAAWRAREGGEESRDYLGPMWDLFVERFEKGDFAKRAELIRGWSKFAVFQPERTLELAKLAIEKSKDGGSDAIDGYLKKYGLDGIPDLLRPVAIYHVGQRNSALDLLWKLGVGRVAVVRSELPPAWKVIADTGSLKHQRLGGPESVFAWLQGRVSESGFRAEVIEKPNPFMGAVLGQWFKGGYDRTTSEEMRMLIQRVAPEPSALGPFRVRVLEWLGAEVLRLGDLACWNVLPVISRSLDVCPRGLKGELSSTEESAVGELAFRGAELLEGVVERQESVAIQLTVWQRVSEAILKCRSAGQNDKLMALRNGITRGDDFQLARVVTSYSSHEWRRERLSAERSSEWDEMQEWWEELADGAVRGFVDQHGVLDELMRSFAELHAELTRFGMQPRWQHVARLLPEILEGKRPDCLSYLLVHPDHPLVTESGLLAVPAHLPKVENENVGWLLKMLQSENPRLIRAALWRISFREFPFFGVVSEQIGELCASSSPAVVTVLADFVGWLSRDNSEYRGPAMRSLPWSRIETLDLQALCAAIAEGVAYGKDVDVSGEMLAGLWDALGECESLEKVLVDHVLEIFHEHFASQMLKVYLARISKGRDNPVHLDATEYNLGKLVEDEGYMEHAKSIFDATAQAKQEDVGSLLDLYHSVVSGVRPDLAAEWLEVELRNLELDRIVAMLGSGKATMIYDQPELLRKVLLQLDGLDGARSAEVRQRLIWKCTPNSRGWSGGQMDPEYRWAHKAAVRMAEAHRDDPVLFEFYRDVARHEEEQMERIRVDYMARHSMS